MSDLNAKQLRRSLWLKSCWLVIPLLIAGVWAMWDLHAWQQILIPFGFAVPSAVGVAIESAVEFLGMEGDETDPRRRSRRKGLIRRVDPYLDWLEERRHAIEAMKLLVEAVVPVVKVLGWICLLVVGVVLSSTLR